ncbi:MAG: MOSC domain-containing protein [Chloroflexota bacterium]
MEIGVVKELYRYPVKSMKGEAIEKSHVFWYGLDGDRRAAFIRGDNQSKFPWLTGRQISQLIQYEPYFTQPNNILGSPIHVKTPSGDDLLLTDPALQEELAQAYGHEVQLINIGRGIFDTLALSLMSTATAAALSQEMGQLLDPDRFRQNIIIETYENGPYLEESWLGRRLTFGEGGAEIRLNQRIQRCAMVNIEPKTAVRNSAVLKMIAQKRDNCVGVVASTEKIGMIQVGDVIRLD